MTNLIQNIKDYARIGLYAGLTSLVVGCGGQRPEFRGRVVNQYFDKIMPGKHYILNLVVNGHLNNDTTQSERKFQYKSYGNGLGYYLPTLWELYKDISKDDSVVIQIDENSYDLPKKVDEE